VPLPPVGGGGSTPPVGCSLAAVSAGVGYCQSSYRCENGYLETLCKDAGNGNGYCECFGSNGARSFELSGVTGADACNAIANLCLGQGPQPTGDEECTLAYTSAGTDSCQRQERCTQKLEDSDSTLTRTRGVQCQGNPLSCYCDSGNRYNVDSLEPAAACERLLDYCDEPAVPGEGPLTCVPQMQGSGQGFCSLYEECSNETDVGDGISAVSVQARYTTCSTSGTGTSLCNCSGSTQNFQFEVDTPTDGLAQCQSVNAICHEGELMLEGEATCTPSNQSASATDCYASLDCVKQGTVGSRNVKVHGLLSVSCSGQGGAYDCACAGDGQQQALKVEADSGWGACTVATERCPSLVEPSFTNGSTGVGGGGGIPIPPPMRPVPVPAGGTSAGG
jgi:hypothetical protein